MTESDAEIAFDIVLLVIAAVGAVLWNLGIIGSVINSGVIDPPMQMFLLLVFAIVLAEIYIVNTDAMKAKLNKVFSSRKKDDFYEKARVQRQREGGS